MIPTLASARVQVDRGMNVPERLMLDPMQVESEKTWGKEAWGNIHVESALFCIEMATAFVRMMLVAHTLYIV
jgi:hypothetical protein